MRPGFWMTAALAITVALASGCGQTAPAPAETHADAHEDQDHDHGNETVATKDGGHDHAGRWCNERGVPVEVCDQCNSKLAAEFQKEGDWCKERDRPDSQCFKCHPKLQAKFAAQYEAGNGRQPTTPEDRTTLWRAGVDETGRLPKVVARTFQTQQRFLAGE